MRSKQVEQVAGRMTLQILGSKRQARPRQTQAPPPTLIQHGGALVPVVVLVVGWLVFGFVIH